MTTLVATNLKNLVADVPAFRTWTGTSTQVDARARVYLAGVDEGGYTRPFALVLTGDRCRSTRIAGGGSDVFIEDEDLSLLLEDDVASGDADSSEDAAVTFGNNAGAVLSGITDLAGQPGYLAVRAIDQVEHPRRFAEDDQDDAYQALYRIEWGV